MENTVFDKTKRNESLTADVVLDAISICEDDSSIDKKKDEKIRLAALDKISKTSDLDSLGKIIASIENSDNASYTTLSKVGSAVKKQAKPILLKELSKLKEYKIKLDSSDIGFNALHKEYKINFYCYSDTMDGGWMIMIFGKGVNTNKKVKNFNSVMSYLSNPKEVESLYKSSVSKNTKDAEVKVSITNKIKDFGLEEFFNEAIKKRSLGFINGGELGDLYAEYPKTSQKSAYEVMMDGVSLGKEGDIAYDMMEEKYGSKSTYNKGFIIFKRIFKELNI